MKHQCFLISAKKYIDGYCQNVQESIPHVGTIYPKFDIYNALKESIIFHSSFYTEPQYRDFITLLRKWQNIKNKDFKIWNCNTIKLNLMKIQKNIFQYKISLQIFDSIIIFDALSDKFEKLFKNDDLPSNVSFEKNNIRIKKIQYIYKNKEYSRY